MAKHETPVKRPKAKKKKTAVTALADEHDSRLDVPSKDGDGNGGNPSAATPQSQLPLEAPSLPIKKPKKRKAPPSETEAVLEQPGAKSKPKKNSRIENIPISTPMDHTPTSTVRTKTSAKLDSLKFKMENRITAIDNWTNLMRDYPTRAEILSKQVDRTQEEIFHLQEEINQERRVLEGDQHEALTQAES